MRRILIVLLFIMPVALSFSLYFLDKEYLLCPIEYRYDAVIRSDSRGDGEFAAKRNGNRIHEGVDLLAETGTPVRAARSGIVIVSRVIENKNKRRGSGNYIIIGHPGGITTTYAHLSEVYVGKNRFIRQGEIIGRVGKTGNANYPDIRAHLHFEVKEGGVARDPLEYFK
ncbi:MAG: M23 family metallopeptidase [Candidatus Omnitrophota bacterium]